MNANNFPTCETVAEAMQRIRKALAADSIVERVGFYVVGGAATDQGKIVDVEVTGTRMAAGGVAFTMNSMMPEPQEVAFVKAGSFIAAGQTTEPDEATDRAISREHEDDEAYQQRIARLAWDAGYAAAEKDLAQPRADYEQPDRTPNPHSMGAAPVVQTQAANAMDEGCVRKVLGNALHACDTLTQQRAAIFDAFIPRWRALAGKEQVAGQAPSYHDVYVTTAGMPRTSIFNLPQGYRLLVTRVAGWELWSGTGAQLKLLASEYVGVGMGLRVDVNGIVVTDSLSSGG